MNVVLIPARGGSKRIERKNLRLLGGKPLIQWSIDCARQLMPICVDSIIVSTEDDEIASAARRMGADVLMRPIELASDTATDHDVVGHYLDVSPTPDRIVYLRPTTPFRDASIVAQAINYNISVNHTSLRSVHEATESAYKMFTRPCGCYGELSPVAGPDGEVWSDAPNQLCPTTYVPNGYVDVIYPKRQGCRPGRVYGPHIFGFVTEPVIELDTPYQWEIAEVMIAKGNHEAKRDKQHIPLGCCQ